MRRLRAATMGAPDDNPDVLGDALIPVINKLQDIFSQARMLGGCHIVADGQHSVRRCGVNGFTMFVKRKDLTAVQATVNARSNRNRQQLC
jgi:hypothetical protein